MKKVIACLLILFICSFLASLVQTSFGKVSIKSIILPTQNGQHLVYDLYKPVSVSKENKAPFVIVVPGFQRSKEALSNIAIELSRRGIVVALIDPYAQGLSSSSLQRRSATKEGYGMFALVDFAYSNKFFNYIDKNKIGTTGHSMGGNAAIRGGNYFGTQALKNNEFSKLHSIYISGYVLTLKDNILKNIRSNAGMSYALYDEGAFRNELSGWDASDMRIAPESIRFINQGLLQANPQVSEVELGKYYGSTSDRSLRVVHNEKLIHPFQPYNSLATSNQIDFFMKVFDLKKTIKSSNQIWQWKELLTLISMISALLMLIPLTRLLLTTKIFNSLVMEVPKPLATQTNHAKIIFWITFFLGATIACISFIPMVDAAKFIFPEASNREITWFFPQRMNNSVMLWAAFNGIVGYLLFFTSYFLFGKNHGVSISSWGANVDKHYLLKALILAITIFGIYYLILFSIYFIFHVDYRF